MKFSTTSINKLILIVILWCGANAQAQKNDFPSPPELEGYGKYIRSLINEGKNAEVANWFFTKNQRINSSNYYTFAAKFYEMAEKHDSAAVSLNLALDNGMSDPNIIEKERLTSIQETSLWKNIKPKLDALDKKLHNIENFQIDTEPMDSFWPYFSPAIADTSQAKKELSQYILTGSQATREYYSDIYKSIDEMYKVMIIENSELYKNCEKLFTAENLKPLRNTVLSGMNELKKVYPKAVFPKVYMMPGIMISGGRSTALGLFIGAERFINSEGNLLEMNSEAIQSIIMHELMHFQQGYRDKENYEKLIGQVIKEGSCDFLRELCTGIQLENENLKYLKSSKNRDFILSEFKKDLFIEDVSSWMYNYNSKDRPVDIGYTLGYLISKSYYEKSDDKKMAVHNLLNTNNFKEIIAQSEYGFVLEASENSQNVANEPVLVTFECGSCEVRNKFTVSGTEDHIFKRVTFPLKHLLKPGKYEMTYWQNKVQQIHLPFSVNPKSNNIITVKE